MLFDFETVAPRDQYKLLASTVVPRPIAWVVTRSPAGQLNAAPYSFFNVLSGEPPVIAIGIGSRSPGVGKDTGDNIRDAREFVVNLVPYSAAQAMNVTAIDFPPGVDELPQAGLTTLPSVKVACPRIADSPVALECVHLSTVDVGPERAIVLGRVLAMHVADDAVIDRDRCYIDTAKLDLVGRMGGASGYVRTSDLFEIPRIDPKDWTMKA